ncbi:tRNA acetyltransferase TAN1, partial [Tremellales sp. Uapishka_1]
MAESSTGKSQSVQKKKFYKFDTAGSGGSGRGRGGSSGRGGGRSGGDDSPSGESKVYPMDRYREKPMPEILTSPGFCATAVKGKERDAEKELIDVLEQIADELYPDTAVVDIKAEQDDDEEMDLEKMLQQELQTMVKPSKSPRYRLCAYDTACISYINVLSPLDPIRILQHLMGQIETTGRSPFKWVQRLTPVSAVGHATLAQLVEIAAPVIKSGFATPTNRALRFGIIPTSRCSSRLDRMEMIKAVAEQIETLGAGHKVDLKEPERTVLIEVFKNHLGISVVQDFDRYKKVYLCVSDIPDLELTSPKFNPSKVAEASAAAQQHPANPDQAASTTDRVGPVALKTSAGPSGKHLNRARAVERMAPTPTESLKRKAEDPEEGQISKMEDFEMGEMVEEAEGDELVGDDIEEIIHDGRVTKMRKL